MGDLPGEIGSVAELEERLSRPDEALAACLRRLPGDILILGAGGKMGPTIARMARRAIGAGDGRRVIAVARRPLPELAAADVETLAADLLDLDAVRSLPRAPLVIYLAGRKFGSTGNEPLTWATNVIVPQHVASTFAASRIVALSTGNVYPLVAVDTGGADEETVPEPLGEYAQSCLGRERVFDFHSATHGARIVHIRLNYAVELRYGVLVDIATKVWRGEPVDVTTGFANVIWQGDAARHILRSLELARSPSAVLNVTGPEIIAVRETAARFGELLGKRPRIAGVENGRAFLNNAARAWRLFGGPSVPLDTLRAWTAAWVRRGGPVLGKPTRFEVQDGKF